ncbi:CamS family sex pheromone protein [Macrococcoides caseolyticum]|uniref:CamS family sex pheromone protein n=1 Tax=Macrococcoides caseolyticum TaxID=69966 RepID=UPI001F2D258A|nr:CamS family sex pheromone protein [Macrococcus caseolyticus]MCE4957474.1 CamS family sex pheromone protein [Macrococcus caseolyticus]
MKRLGYIVLSAIMLASCSNNDAPSNEQSKEKDEKQIATDIQISNDYFRTLLPFKESQARGLTSTNMASSYNGEAFESGLLRISKNVFSPDDYLYRDGQLLNKDAVESYLEPQYTKAEIDQMDKDERIEKNAYANFGLNPSHKGETDPEKIAEQSPAYLSHIIEQDFFTESDAKRKKISGMTIGLAMNSVYYYQKEEYGEVYSKALDVDTVEKKGKEMADEILSRLRVKPELKDIPITFAIFIQSSSESITPGNFVSYAVSEENSKKMGKWKAINEKYVLLPSGEADQLNEKLNNDYKQFNEQLQTYFPNFTQSIGTGYFVNDSIQSLNINVPLDYFGKAEVIGVTQYIADLAMKSFNHVDHLEISIVDNDKPLALIVKDKEDKEPKIHVYQQ